MGSHAAERINDMGIKAVMRCVLCGKQGSMSSMMQNDCESEAQVSFGDALIALIESGTSIQDALIKHGQCIRKGTTSTP